MTDVSMKEPLADEVFAAKAGRVDVARTTSRTRGKVAFTVRFREREEDG